MANAEDPHRQYAREIFVNAMFTAKFLFDSANRLNWGDLSHSTVMDIGCGLISFKIFDTAFPKFHKVIAIDKSFNSIKYLKLYEKHENMEYHVADITDRSTLIEWEAKMSKIVSFYCFNYFTDLKSGFANIHYLLQPGGEAIILTALKDPHFECAKHLLQKPKWSMYQHLENKYPDSQAQGTGIGFYEKVLNDLDFEIITCVEVTRVIAFATEEEFRASPLTKDRMIAAHLPTDEQKEFEEDYAQTLMEINGRSAIGEYHLRPSAAKIFIRRKKS